MAADVFVTTSSAMSAYGTRQQASAHNLANTNTNGFEPTRVTLADRADNGGVRVQDTRTETDSSTNEPQDKVTLSSRAKEAGSEDRQVREEPSETEVAKEMVRMRENREAYAANASVAQAQRQMQGSLINQIV